MKTIYESPKMDVVEFEVEDIITTSIGGDISNKELADLLKPSDPFNGGGIF